ncbi:hypothetical protein ACMATS_05820 [Streptoverticillium reticulum]|uniref:hypothetical protein n=1 Tax=Streptoverticillium reticulum TaxID=1433415 RepID=UPI0039BF622D
MVCCRGRNGGGGCTCKLTGKDGIVPVDKGGGTWEIGVDCAGFPCSGGGGGVSQVKGEDGISAVTDKGVVTVKLDCTKPLPDSCKQQLKGDPGGPGAPGKDGTNGKDGAPGRPGDPGQPGDPGAPGKSAYQVAVDEGFKGTEQEWLASLKGTQGPPGEQGPPGDPTKLTCAELQPVLQPCLDVGSMEWTAGGKLTAKTGTAVTIKGKDGSGVTAAETTPGSGIWEVGVDCTEFPCTGGGSGIQSVQGEDGITADTKDGHVTVKLDCSKPLPDACKAQLKGDPGTPGKDGDPGRPGDPGVPGKSAYQIAIDKGEWTPDPQDPDDEKKWVASLKGKQGDPGTPGAPGKDGDPGAPGKDGAAGKSAFEQWKEETGKPDATWEEFQKDITGAPGPKGTDGKDGDPGTPGKDGAPGTSAYQEWLDAGNTGSEEDFLKSLVGPQGKPGDPGTPGKDGDNGKPGDPGPAGKSAYQQWLDAGNTGSADDFLASLKGAKGEQGPPGDPTKLTCPDMRTVLQPCLDDKTMEWPQGGKLTAKGGAALDCATLAPKLKDPACLPLDAATMEWVDGTLAAKTASREDCAAFGTRCFPVGDDPTKRQQFTIEAGKIYISEKWVEYQLADLQNAVAQRIYGRFVLPKADDVLPEAEAEIPAKVNFKLNNPISQYGWKWAAEGNDGHFECTSKGLWTAIMDIQWQTGNQDDGDFDYKAYTSLVYAGITLGAGGEIGPRNLYNGTLTRGIAGKGKRLVYGTTVKTTQPCEVGDTIVPSIWETAIEGTPTSYFKYCELTLLRAGNAHATDPISQGTGNRRGTAA